MFSFKFLIRSGFGPSAYRQYTSVIGSCLLLFLVFGRAAKERPNPRVGEGLTEMVMKSSEVYQVLRER
jgi:hypothetical protein